MDLNAVQTRKISSEQCYPLRQAILRPKMSMDASKFANDELGTHFGAFVDHQLLSIASLHKEKHPSFSVPLQFRLRGMATASNFQGQGLGMLVLRACIDFVQKEKADLLWCNAREKAILFYERAGFQVQSDFFVMEGIGVHKLMSLEFKK